jgi:hypothetical protein
MPLTFRKNRDFGFDATWEGIKLDHFLHVPLLVSLGGGLVAMVGGLFAQASTNEAVANAGLWAALAGIVASCTALLGSFAKIVYDNKQKAREHEMAMQRELFRNEIARDSTSKNRKKIRALVQWTIDMKAKHPDLPEPPDIDFNVIDVLTTPDSDVSG